MTLADGQARLYRQLAGTGALAPEWRSAYWRAPRHRFVPYRAWMSTDAQPLDREADPDAWSAAVYADEPVIIQLNDGRPGATHYTSSVSQPSLVFAMLDHLDVADRMRVLEVGTGGGWNAGLLSARLGDDRVTSVEIDPALAAQATGALAAVGLHPDVVIADGVDGYPPGAPYDRIIATAAARSVPYAWVEQVRTGGTILLPFGTAFCNGALLRLTVHADGTASGRFIADDYGFMWLRGDRQRFDLVERIRPEHDRAERTTELHPSAYLLPDAVMPIGLAVPDVAQLTVFWDGEDDRTDPAGGVVSDDSRYTVYLVHPASGSWASVAVTTRGESVQEHTVWQHGPRRLADEVEAAWRRWDAAGRPGVERYEVRVTRERTSVVVSPAVADHTATLRR